MRQKCTPSRLQFVRLCECGCGEPTLLARQTNTALGWVKGQPLRYLSGHTGRQPARKVKYHARHRPDHPLANRGGYVGEHRIVLYERIGPGTHPCHWCGTPVTWNAAGHGGGPRGALVPDHIDGNGLNNAPQNLVPSCHRCNITRSHPNTLQPGELFVEEKDGRRHRAVERVCLMCGATFPHRASARRPDQGRFCSASCARRYPFRHRVTVMSSPM